MIVRSLVVVAVWICLSPLLCTASSEVRYVAINQSELLNISMKGTDHVEWKTDDNVLSNKMKNFCGPIIKCQLYPNGSLLVTDVESFGERTYTYTTYTDRGEKSLQGEFKVIVIEMVKTPEISYECSTRKLQCVVPSGNVSNITITWNGQKKPSFNEHQTLIQLEISTKKAINVSCVAKGKLNQMEKTVWIDCTNFWTIYMILGVTGGGIAFIIFLILLIYCIKLRCDKTHGRDDVEISYQQPNQVIQQRQLPQPPLQSNTQSNTQSLTRPGVNPPEHSPGQRQQATNRQVPPIPPTQTKKGTHSKQKGAKPPKKQAQRPSLPSNHPAEQPPRPQPRNPPKQSHQPRKKQ
ncbi:T-cell surface antigen CD2-like [Pelobates fuscus]|uniref:T-cell surface antigen CD2-like n=1 Tax=Pelobates fuscus TaxID=191477 RepID=UPI002FE4A4A1